MESGAFYGRSMIRGFLAGIAIAIGGCVFIGCKDMGVAWVGAILFAIGLLTVFSFGLDLYTGKVGYWVERPDKLQYLVYLVVITVGNFIGTLFVGIFIPSDTAVAMVNSKLDNYDAFYTLGKGIFCGVLMFIAADFYKTRQSFTATFFCVPVFILAGFEHSIADMFYFCSAGVYSVEGVIFIFTVIIGNAIGGMLIPFCRKYMKEPEPPAEAEKSQ